MVGRLTISPKLLTELSDAAVDVPENVVEQKLVSSAAAGMDIEKIDVDENAFRWMMNETAVATEKLAEGIRNFSADIVKLETVIKEKIA